MVRKFKTNLNCGSCVAAVAPLLDREAAIERWSVDTSDARKVLTVEGAAVAAQTVERLVAEAGFRVLGEIAEPPASANAAAPASAVASAVPAAPAGAKTSSFLATYRPLLLIFGYLIGVVALVDVVLADAARPFDWMNAMRHFMGGFFLAFSFFKLLDLPGFADSFQTYDLLARRSRAYGYVYPFIELLLGVAYVVDFRPLLTNLATLAVMLIGLMGVSQALLQTRQIRCACLGALFNLPMSKVTFMEDALMAAMAVAMLVAKW